MRKRHPDHQYFKILRNILKTGVDRPGSKYDRPGIEKIVPTRAVFERQMRFNLQKGFPILTTKEVNFKSVVRELLWFIKGSQDVKELQATGCHIWDANANSPYWKPKAKFEGDVGRIYGVQWRKWKTINENALNKLDLVIESGDKFSSFLISEILKDVRKTIIKTVDQLANVIESIKNNPNSRRHIMVCWNPAELDKMCLPPCHDVTTQFFAAEGKLSMFMYQRSCDMFLGVPFNISSSSLFLSMIAQVTDLTPYQFIYQLGDVHIYYDHFEQVKEQLWRIPLALPKLWLNPEIKNIDDFKSEDIRLDDYKCHPFIKAEMAV